MFMNTQKLNIPIKIAITTNSINNSHCNKHKNSYCNGYFLYQKSFCFVYPFNLNVKPHHSVVSDLILSKRFSFVFLDQANDFKCLWPICFKNKIQ